MWLSTAKLKMKNWERVRSMTLLLRSLPLDFRIALPEKSFKVWRPGQRSPTYMNKTFVFISDILPLPSIQFFTRFYLWSISQNPCLPFIYSTHLLIIYCVSGCASDWGYHTKKKSSGEPGELLVWLIPPPLNQKTRPPPHSWLGLSWYLSW